MDLTQTFVTMQRIEEVDMHDFLFKLKTGRLLNDGKMCVLVNMKISELIREVGYYCRFKFDMIQQTSLEELREKNYITNKSKKLAKEIADLYNNNFWDLNK